MRAEERPAAFLLNLSRRFVRRGYSPSEFHLRMTREEIGSYLGLKLETVSWIFSRFQDDGLIEVQQKHVRMLDTHALEQMLAAKHRASARRLPCALRCANEETPPRVRGSLPERVTELKSSRSSPAMRHETHQGETDGKQHRRNLGFGNGHHIHAVFRYFPFLIVNDRTEGNLKISNTFLA